MALVPSRLPYSPLWAQCGLPLLAPVRALVAHRAYTSLAACLFVLRTYLSSFIMFSLSFLESPTKQTWGHSRLSKHLTE